jgi:aspartyl-tRNA(Asn)/glutamyl-tRNA(Gln) amidotransferase subunit A
MCLGALGTQTGGSITRPASFCGVAGMKPSKAGIAVIMASGIAPFAPSLDHVGPIGRTIDDLGILYWALQIRDSKLGPNIEPADGKPPRLGRLRGFFDQRADPAVRSKFEEAAHALAANGAEIVELDDPVDFEQVLQDHRMIMAAEAARVHSGWLTEFPDDYPPRIRELILEGRPCMDLEVVDIKDPLDASLRDRLPLALKFTGAVKGMAATMSALVKHRQAAGCAAWITPATVGTAPDRGTTGDPAFNSPWSYTGQPTVTFPIGPAADGLPVGLQIVGDSLHDGRLLQVARWCEQAIRPSRQ